MVFEGGGKRVTGVWFLGKGRSVGFWGCRARSSKAAASGWLARGLGRFGGWDRGQVCDWEKDGGGSEAAEGRRLGFRVSGS